MLQKNLRAFDDYTPLSYEGFVWFITQVNCWSFEVGDGLGLITFTISGHNAYIQWVMYDYKFRRYLFDDLIWLLFDLGIRKIISLITEDRDYAREFAISVGAVKEGTIRQAFFRDGKYLDVDIYSLNKEE